MTDAGRKPLDAPAGLRAARLTIYGVCRQLIAEDRPLPPVLQRITGRLYALEVRLRQEMLDRLNTPSGGPP